MVVWCMYGCCVVLLIIVYRIMDSLSSVFPKKVFWETKKFSEPRTNTFVGAKTKDLTKNYVKSRKICSLLAWYKA